MLLLFLLLCERWVQGFNNGTFRFVDKKTTCYTCGNFIVFLDMETKSRKTLQSPGSGIGAFTASGHRRCLAFSDLKLNPSIFVYNYPELEQICKLKGESIFYISLNNKPLQLIVVALKLFKCTQTFINVEKLHFQCFFMFQVQLNWAIQL